MAGQMSNERIKVLFISGWGRSGSTLLDNILGQVDGFFSCGELRLWARRFATNYFCGCGAHLKECGVWREILERAFGAIDEIDAQEMLTLFDRGCRLYHVPLMAVPGGDAIIERGIHRYLANLEKLYREIHAVTGCRVIVDSSKFPPYGYAAGMLPSVDLYVVHLVRDPRAVAYSWLRQKGRTNGAHSDDPLYSRQLNPFQCSVRWNILNLMTEMLWKQLPGRYVMLRYEDFVRSPRQSLESILTLVGESPTQLPLVAEDQVEILVNHTVSGNPSRYKSGIVKLHLDEEWKSMMASRDIETVNFFTGFLRTKYRYGM